MPSPQNVRPAITDRNPEVVSLGGHQRESQEHYFGSVRSVLCRRVEHVLDTEHLCPILCRARNNMQPFEYLVDYYGLRYYLLLERNMSTEDSIENELLWMLSCAVDCRDYRKEDSEIANCLDVFWPHIARDCDQRGPRVTDKPTIKDRLARKPFIKIQLKTLNDGALHKVSHDAVINYPLSDPIDNPCQEVRLFEKEEIEHLDEIDRSVFKVRINGEIFCVKAARREALRREISVLAKLPSHPSLPRLVGLVNAGKGKVDRFVSSFIDGEGLHWTRRATEDQKKKWKEQVSAAVRVLHENDIVWGDVNPGNVVIESETDRAVLVDFAGGAAVGWVDRELKESKDGDLQGLNRLCRYIDDIKTAGIGPSRALSEASLKR